MGSEEKHQRPTVISRSRSSESSVGRAIQASHGPGLNSAKHPLISVYKVGKVFIAAIEPSIEVSVLLEISPCLCNCCES